MVGIVPKYKRDRSEADFGIDASNAIVKALASARLSTDRSAQAEQVELSFKTNFYLC